MTIDLMRDVFMWCSIINIGLLLLSFVFLWQGHDWVYRVHTRWFKMSREQFDAIWYGALAFYKICIFLFNIVPYIALCIVG
jgi:hypothetical protein